MSLFNPSIGTPLRYESVEALRTLIQAAATIVNSQGIVKAAHVYLHYVEEPVPDRYIVVRERADIVGPLQTLPGQVVVPIQVMASITRERPNPHKWLAAIHKLTFAAVVNQKPALTNGAMALPFYRQAGPTTPQLDPDDDEWYSTALYYAVLQPIG